MKKECRECKKEIEKITNKIFQEGWAVLDGKDARKAVEDIIVLNGKIYEMIRTDEKKLKQLQEREPEYYI